MITSTISIAVEDERKGVQWGRFLHETDAPFQILFVVRGKSDTMRGLRIYSQHVPEKKRFVQSSNYSIVAKGTQRDDMNKLNQNRTKTDVERMRK